MRVFVACSSSDSIPLSYKTLASNLCTFLAKNNHKLVFGGSDTGMMGKCYMTYKFEGGKVKAIVTLHDKDVLDNIEVDAYDVGTTTFDRTKMLYEACELVIILPGGIGTYAELFSIIDETREKKLTTPIVLFNYNNFYTPMLKFLTKNYEEGFMSQSDLKTFSVVNDLSSLEKYIKKIEGEK